MRRMRSGSRIFISSCQGFCSVGLGIRRLDLCIESRNGFWEYGLGSRLGYRGFGIRIGDGLRIRVIKSLFLKGQPQIGPE